MLLGRTHLAADSKLPSIWNVGVASTDLWVSWLAKGDQVFLIQKQSLGLVDQFFQQKCMVSSAGKSQTMSGMSHLLSSLLCRSKREGRQIPCLPSCRLVMKWWTSTRWSWAAPGERPSPWWKAPTRSWSLSSAGRQEPQSFPVFFLPHRPPSHPPHFSSWRFMAWPNLSTSLVLSTQGQMLVLFSQYF